MSDGASARDFGGILGVVDTTDWKGRAALYKTLAEKRLEEIERQDAEIGELRRELAALRAVAK